MARICVDDGAKIYEIVNKAGQTLGEFMFNPADIGIVERYDEAVKRYESLEIPEGENEVELVNKVGETMIDIMDYLIDGDSRDAFFKKTKPLQPLASGEFYIENCLNAVAKVIEAEIGARTKKVKTRMDKYTVKYHK